MRNLRIKFEVGGLNVIGKANYLILLEDFLIFILNFNISVIFIHGK
jgi:hypothetical protein